MPTQFRLSGETMEGIRFKLFNEYGNRARILSAEKIIEGGLLGFGAKVSIEALIEIDGGSTKTSATPDLPNRSGIARLLAQAEELDAVPVAPERQLISTSTESFDAVLHDLTERYDTEGHDSVPHPSVKPGDLILVVGFADTALKTALSMSHATGAEVRTSGSHRANGIGHVLLGGNGIIQVQALAAVAGKSLIVAYSLGDAFPTNLNDLTGARPDQMWVVVDASAKIEDTERWVQKVGWAIPINAIAAYGTERTSSPHTVNTLNLPIGWVDNYQATAPQL